MFSSHRFWGMGHRHEPIAWERISMESHKRRQAPSDESMWIGSWDIETLGPSGPNQLQPACLILRYPGTSPSRNNAMALAVRTCSETYEVTESPESRTR